MRRVAVASVPAIGLIAGTQLFGGADDKGGAYFAAPVVFAMCLFVITKLPLKK